MNAISTPRTPDYFNALVASFLGWALDSFDFFILVFVMPRVAKDFGTDIPAIALTISLTLAMRPVGAFIFGLMADRYGRRLPLMIDLVFFSLMEFLSGLAPNYTVFLILRVLFGIGMGGEWGVGASLTMEKVPPKRRGLLSGILQEGYNVGYLLAACCYFFVFPAWGWRAMFFIGGVPALVALFVRFKVKESEVWQKTRYHDWGNLTRGILQNWKLFLYLAAMMTMMHFAGHGTQDMYPTFLKEQHGFASREVALIAIVYTIGAILGGITTGLYSDRIGRRRGMITTLCLAIAAIPLWAYSQNTALVILGAFIMQFLVQGAWGVVPAHTTELSPDSVRGFLPGFAYQSGALIGGSVVYLEAVFAKHFSYSNAMALTALVVFSVAALLVGLGKEKRSVQFGFAAGS